MNFSQYLTKSAWLPCQAEIQNNPNLIVVIPAYKEPELDQTLISLANCENPDCQVAVLAVINRSETDDEKTILENENCKKSLLALKQNLPAWLTLTILEPPPFPSKFAGPGLARKVGMDEATRWFSETNNSNGIILSLDADSTVAHSYLKSVKSAFSDATVRAVSIYFEHPLSGSDSPAIYEAITRYELYLRYYIHALRLAGYPFAFQTIGSSFAVRADVYARSGGMNRRKAGEDFYFLHKLIPDGGFFDLTTTTVFPSSRKSDRVPFGTGRAVMDYIEKGDSNYPVYHPHIFDEIKKFLEIRELTHFSADSISDFLDSLSPSLQICRKQRGVDQRLTEIRLNASSAEAFKKRFLKWFDGFEVLKWVHLLRDEVYGTLPVIDASMHILEKAGIKPDSEKPEKLLAQFRELDRSQKFTIIF
ncbi:MAG: glycosyltransferase family 2 protein [Bacteroidetes bacterium]|nr:glycosyltransferase family 2 protein [Bacteroidota bacterium]